MRLLLDTHILIWAFQNSARLPVRARDLLADGGNQVFCSVVSLWEVALKHLSRPDRMPMSPQEFQGYVTQAGFDTVALDVRHVLQLSTLFRCDGAPSHNDPFDRILVCQAKSDGMLLVTHDEKLADYLEPCVMMV